MLNHADCNYCFSFKLKIPVMECCLLNEGHCGKWQWVIGDCNNSIIGSAQTGGGPLQPLMRKQPVCGV